MAARRWLGWMVGAVALAAACRVDAPDLAGYSFLCEGEEDCPAGQRCQDGVCEPDPGNGDADPDDPDASVDPSLLAHLPLDLLSGDESPDVAGDHAASCETGSCPLTATGQIDGALELDGIDDGMTLAGSGGISPAAGTVAVWLYLPAVPPAGESMTVVGKAFGTGLENSYELYVDDGGIPIFYTTAAEIVAPSPVPEAAWVHLAATWTATTLRLFVDGEPAGSAAGTPTFDGNPVLLGMDRNDGAEDSFLEGRLDEVRIYDRALDEAEIAGLAE